jgi:iron complex outermembrane receptor protein
MSRALFTIAAVVLPGSVLTQQDSTSHRDTAAVVLTPVVTVAREAGRSTLELPYAISSQRPDSQRPGQRHVLISDATLALNGVVVADRTNPTQDPRISIRGVGARSSFGVRGIRILRDGMPLTLPDGQTPVDYLDLEAIGRVEAMRGAASSLYGNASGGVIDFRSAPFAIDPVSGQVRASFAGYNSERITGVVSGGFARGGYEANYGYTSSDGYRAHSNVQLTNGYGHSVFGAGAWDLGVQVMGLDMPTALNPGALNRTELDTNPRQADPRSVLKDASKSVKQVQLGLSARRTIDGDGEFSAQLYGGTRNLYNPLTFAVVNVDRYSYGGSARAFFPGHLWSKLNRLTAGIDAALQNDDRQNWNNCHGVPTVTAACPVLPSAKGTLTLDQTEIVSSLGPYVRDELELSKDYILSLGVRGDWTRFTVQDHFLADSDNSGSATMSAVSPMIGFVARTSPLHSLYANIAAGFETPTATELANHEDGSAGINPDLKPQHSWNFEIGAKGVLARRFVYDLALYDTEVQEELIPYQVTGGGGRVYYRNAGQTRRYGLEVGLNSTLGPWELGVAYSWSHFRFVEFVVDTNRYNGNAVPGVPENVLQLQATYHYRTLFATAELVNKSSIWVNDANTADAPAYTTVNLRLGGTALLGRPWLQPVIGVSNLFNKSYVGSVAVNAAAGRYYEPAPTRVYYAGLTVGYNH